MEIVHTFSNGELYRASSTFLYLGPEAMSRISVRVGYVRITHTDTQETFSVPFLLFYQFSRWYQ